MKPNDSDGLYSVNYIGLIPHLVKANNELNERLKLLEKKLNIFRVRTITIAKICSCGGLAALAAGVREAWLR